MNKEKNSSTRRTIDYAITVTVKPKFHCLLPEDQFDKATDELLRKLASVKARHSCVAEFTKAYNIHYHLIVNFPYNVKFHMRFIYDQFRDSQYIGFVYVKPVDDYYKWTDYMMKSVKDTYQAFKCRHPVISNDYDLVFHLLEMKLVVPDSKGSEEPK